MLRPAEGRDSFTVDDSGFGVVHAGPKACDDLAHLVARIGAGRAFVLVDVSVGARARECVETAVSRSRMSTRIIEVPNAVHAARQRCEMARQLAGYSGGALVTVGSSALIAVGKSIAAMAHNGSFVAGRHVSVLPLAPRKHIAVPVGLGPAEEATSLVDIGEQAPQAVVDDRVSALSVIDERLFPDHDTASEQYTLLAIALAACTASDDSASMRDHTLALAAAHQLVKPELRPADLRHALTLATAGHRRWPLCQRCHAGTHIPAAVHHGALTSPAGLCLQQAMARGLSVIPAP